jgi:hypothetical protein
MSFLSAGRMTDALRDLRRSLELEAAIADLDPKGTATRFAMADIQSRLASVFAAMAKRTRSPANQQHWREAAKYFRRADALYAALAAEGLVQSPQIQAHAKQTNEGAREAAEQLAKD